MKRSSPLLTLLMLLGVIASGAHGFRLWAGLSLAVLLPSAGRVGSERLPDSGGESRSVSRAKSFGRVAVQVVSVLAGAALLTPWSGPVWLANSGRMLLAFVLLAAAAGAIFLIGLIGIPKQPLLRGLMSQSRRGE